MGGAGAVARRLILSLVAVVAAIGYAWLPQWLDVSAQLRDALDVFVSAVLMLAIALVPFFARLRNLEPRQFAVYPASPGSLAGALFVTSVCTWSMVLLLIWQFALLLRHPEWFAVPWAVAAWIVLTMLLAIGFVRVSSGVAPLLFSRKAQSVMRWFGLLLLLAVLPVVVFILSGSFGRNRSSTLLELVSVLEWTPFGGSLAALELIAAGSVQEGIARFAVSAATVCVLVFLWFFITVRSVTSIAKPVPQGIASDGLELFERFPARPRAVIAARSLSYWRRDPRYRVALIAIPLAPIAMIVALHIAGVDASVLALLPLPVMLLLLGWSVHNDVALDSTAIWMHVASGTRGRHDRSGRLAPVLLIGVPLAVIGSSVTVTVSGDWRILPAVLGMNIAVLFTAAGVSSVFSVLMPYPATRPGDSPFAQPAVQGSGAGLAQSLSMVCAILGAIPAMIPAIHAIVEPSFSQNVVALFAGIAWGVCVLWAGVLLGGRLFDRSAPELVALTQTFD